MSRLSTAIYLRISQDPTGQGTNVGIQEADCLRLCERMGWETGPVYRDNDESAYRRKKPRPAYTEMMEAVRAGLHDRVVVYHPTRLLRDNRELEDWVDLVERRRVQIHFVQAPDYDLNTASGRLVARVLAAGARSEVEQMSERIQRKMAWNASEGRPAGGTAPYGYRKQRKADGRVYLVIDPSEAKHVREAARRVVAGETLYAIASDWNERGVRPQRVDLWSTTALKVMLTRGSSAGLRTHQGEVIGEGNWKPILDRATWEKVRARLLSEDRRRNPVVRSYLLSGLLRCGLCGFRMIAIPRTPARGSQPSPGERTVRAYGCKKVRGGCGKVHILAGTLEEFIVEMALSATEGVDLRSARSQPDDTVVVEAIKEDEDRLGELAEMWANREMERSEWLLMRSAISKRLEKNRKGLEPKGAKSLAQVVGKKGTLRAVWPKLNFQQRHFALEVLIDSITIGPSTGARNRFNPDRIEVLWRA